MKLLPQKFFNKDYIGVSISQTAVRAVSVNSDKKINAQAEVKLPPETFTHSSINQAQLTQALKQLLASGRFKSNYAAISIPEFHSFTRSHSIPKMALSEVSEALNWQIEKIFPLPKESIYFDWKLISETETCLNIVIVAVHKKTLDQLIQVMDDANIKPISFEPSASALTRILSIKENESAILVEVNPQGSSSSLVENHLSSLTITNQFQTSSQLNEIKQALNTTSQSIQSLINLHQSKKPQASEPLKIFLTGDSASEELTNWLGSYLNQKVELVNIPSVPPHLHQAFAVANTSIHAPKTGLGINLLPDSLEAVFKATRNYQDIKTKIQVSLTFLIFSLSITAATFFFVLFQSIQAQNELNQLEVAGSDLTYNATTVSLVNKASNAIVKLFPRKTTPVEAIEQLLEIAPTGIDVKSYTYDKEKSEIAIIGFAIDRPALLEFRQVLETSETFEQVQVPLVSLEKPTDIDFSIKTKIASTQ